MFPQGILRLFPNIFARFQNPCTYANSDVVLNRKLLHFLFKILVSDRIIQMKLIILLSIYTSPIRQC